MTKDRFWKEIVPACLLASFVSATVAFEWARSTAPAVVQQAQEDQERLESWWEEQRERQEQQRALDAQWMESCADAYERAYEDARYDLMDEAWRGDLSPGASVPREY
jgi:hypothetical protein